jgi:hypothetical protein
MAFHLVALFVVLLFPSEVLGMHKDVWLAWVLSAGSILAVCAFVPHCTLLLRCAIAAQLGAALFYVCVPQSWGCCRPMVCMPEGKSLAMLLLNAPMIVLRLRLWWAAQVHPRRSRNF